MRILYHHRTASRDGQAVHIDELIAAFGRRGHEVRIVGPTAGEGMGFGDENRLIAFLKRKLPGMIYELVELAYSCLTALRLRRQLKQFRPDFFYERYNLFSPAGAWLRRRYRVPFLLEVNAPLAEERAKYGDLKLRRLANWSQRFAWRNADRVLPVTRVLAGHVTRAGVEDARITVIQNGIDRQRFHDQIDSTARRRELGLQQKLVLGFTGFIREWHGLDEIIRTLAEMGRDDAHLLLVGDGPGRVALTELARQLGVSERVHFAGLVGRDEVAEYIACFDIALQPSVTPYASPLKLFEYMAMEKAIIAPGTPNICEVLQDGVSACLFDPADAGSMRGAINKLCNDPSLRARLAAGAKAEITRQRLTWDENAERIEQIASQLIAEMA
ncbi:MAG: glycosyltransferase family 4 protein [Gammaproteobacteria bacterium]|nr:glycosyltransferase family 4 protein [Gammaproteobacteria bacterium]